MTLGQVGYQAYGDKAGWKNYQGMPMPKWEDLPDHIVKYWEASAAAIAHCEIYSNYIKCILVEDENGENHKIEVDAQWKDSHHFLDMFSAILEKWRIRDH